MDNGRWTGNGTLDNGLWTKKRAGEDEDEQEHENESRSDNWSLVTCYWLLDLMLLTAYNLLLVTRY